MDYRVVFIAEGVSVRVPEGTTLLEAQIRANLPADAPCGGRGTCKKCAVEYRKAGEPGWNKELACQVRVDADCEVRLLRGNENLQIGILCKRFVDGHDIEVIKDIIALALLALFYGFLYLLEIEPVMLGKQIVF